jgi:hypothetical protein
MTLSNYLLPTLPPRFAQSVVRGFVGATAGVASAMFFCQRSMSLPTPWYGFSGDGERIPPCAPSLFPLVVRVAVGGRAGGEVKSRRGDGLDPDVSGAEVPNKGDARRIRRGDVRPLAFSEICGVTLRPSSPRDSTGEADGDRAGKRAAALDREVGEASELSGVCNDPSLSASGLLATGGGPGFGAAICLGTVPIDSYF